MKKIATIQPSRLSGIFTFFTLISVFTSCSFTNYTNPVTGLTYYATEDVKTQSPPSFPGGHQKLEEFIKTEIKNLPDGIKLGRQVRIRAKIDEMGKVVELKPAYNADPPLEKELTRIAALMPTWQAGVVNGKGVTTDYTFLLKRNE
jgi:hypothetical protein